jgi:hypothetical protein
MAEYPSSTRVRLGHFVNYYKTKSVELTGFEPVTPSLRKMWSKPSDQGKRGPFAGLWAGCGPSHVRRREGEARRVGPPVIPNCQGPSQPPHSIP